MAHTLGMLKQIAVNREASDVRHAELLEVVEFLAEHDDYANGTNALVCLARKSTLYRRTVENPEFQSWRKKQLAEEAS